MSDGDEWIDDEAGSDEQEAIGDNEIRSQDVTNDPLEVDDATEAGDEIPLGLNETEVRALDSLFSGTGAPADVFADQAPLESEEPVSSESVPDTVPLLDASGNTPADFDELYKALRQWEAAAADAPGDPRFTPKLTTKPRRDLLSIDRGPYLPFVWLDRSTMTPVKYAGEKPQSPTEDFSLPMDSAGRVGVVEHAESALGITQPVVLVDLSNRDRFIRAELDAFSDRMIVIGKRTAKEAVDYYDWVCWTEERAISGDWM